MSANEKSQTDHTGLVVLVVMTLLAVLGIVTVFHGPISAVLFPPPPGESFR